jgi:hypothetical protein
MLSCKHLHNESVIVKVIRRLVLAISLLIIVICSVLLLNVTAPNPTHRRYSSQSPLMTGQGSANQIGLSAEQILSADLHLPRNDEPDQRQCVCNEAGKVDPNSCRICIVKSTNIDTYRRPDFVGVRFLAESKNTRGILYDSRDAAQIADFVTAAKETGYPLWVYTRVNTVFPADLQALISSTGGGVVPYFTTAGYSDPTDETANYWLFRAGLVFIVVLGVEGLAVMSSRSTVSQPHPTKIPVHPVTQTKQSVDQAEQSLNEHLDRVRRKLD